MPHVNNTDVPCSQSTVADDTACSADVTNTATCNGCIGVVAYLGPNEAAVESDLQGRYGSTDCNTFINDMKEVYTNFYQIKRDDVKPVADDF